MNNLLGSGIINLVLIGILIYGLIKHGIKGMLGLLVLVCLVAAIANKPGIMIEFGSMFLDLMKSLVSGV